MTGPFFIEVLSRHGDVRYRQRVETLPVRIGRAYDNDVILDDPAISSHHLQLEQTGEGGLIVRDLGSENGIVCKGAQKKDLEIDGDTIFRIGHSSLRVRSADFAVAPEKKLSTSRRVEGWRAATAGLTMIVGLTLISTWVTDTEKFELLRYVGSTFAMLILGLLWCGIWAFATRLYSGRAQFGRHLFIAASALVCMDLWGVASGLTAYAFSLESLSRYGNQGAIVVVAVMIFFQLMTVNPHLKRTLVVVSVVVALMGSSGVLMMNYYRYNRLADELYMSYRFPPIVRISGDKPVAQLIADTKKLKADIDRDRTKPVATSDEDDTGGED